MVSHWQHGRHFHVQHIFLRHLKFWKTNIHWNTSILYLWMFRRLLGAIVVTERWILVSPSRFVAKVCWLKLLLVRLLTVLMLWVFPTPQILTLWDDRSSRPPSQSIWRVWNETRKSTSSPTGASIKGAVCKTWPESLFYTSINELTKPTECEEMTSMYCGAKMSVEVSMPSS